MKNRNEIKDTDGNIFYKDFLKLKIYMCNYEINEIIN